MATDFWVPFLATSSGVVFAFFLNSIYERDKNIRARAETLELVRAELAQAQKDLNVQKRFQFPYFTIHDSLWDSVVSSGSLNLFKPNEQIALSRTYTNMKNYNNEIDLINSNIQQAANLVNILKNPELRQKFIELDELNEKLENLQANLKTVEEAQHETELQINIKETEAKIAKINDELKNKEITADTLRFIKTMSAYQLTLRLESVLEVITMQEWFQNDKKRCHWRAFPLHMSKKDEKLYEEIRDIRRRNI